MTVAAIILFYSRSMTIESNVISGISTYSDVSYLDGAGIDLDLGNTLITVRYNYVTGCAGDASNDLSGQGFMIFGSELNYIYSNVFVHNRYGVMFGDDNAGVAGVPNYLMHNTIAHSTWDGIRTVFTVEQVNVIQNNIIAYSGRYGVSSLGTGTQTLVTNDLYMNTIGDYNSQTAGATDITDDPVLTSDYKTGIGSGARRAGTSWPGATDFRGRQFGNPPDIGAYQSSGGDVANTRGAGSARTSATARSARV